MHERSAVQKLDGRGGGVRGRGIGGAAGVRDRQAKARADAMAAGEYGVAQRGGEQGRRAGALGVRYRLIKSPFDTGSDRCILRSIRI